MLLKNLMEEKQLDFNQPLLSVRRFASTVSITEADNKRKMDNARPRVPPLSVYKSELKSGPLTNPGTVPFVWEKSPGRPKYESKPQTAPLAQPPAVPKLPPGRILNVERKALDKGSEGTTGQSETRNGLLGSHNVPSLDKNATEEESSGERTEETDISGLDHYDEAYVGALDTLSRSESFFLNCSVSGVSGLDSPDIKPSGTISTDPQTRDFMMGRFLPAAKAITSETAQHSTRKLPAVQEQSRNKEDGNCGRTASIQSMQRTKHLWDVPSVTLTKFLVSFESCTKDEERGQLHTSPTHVKKVDSSCAAHCSETVNEHDKDVVYHQRSVGALRTTGVHEDENELKNESNKIACRNDYQKLDGSSLYKCLQGNGSSPCRGKFAGSAVDEEKGYLVIPGKYKNSGMNGFKADAKGGKSFRELLAKERNEWESTSASPVVEKLCT
ncbi:hypothetical protein GH714_015073 [Hevea brasiliensis]|uniref:Uncharacterized protein n=1 Tax=Hevea brasiliensis TaxID=3981 RepID=A0A6A6KRM6_HEVBR|nr:hypothetical protein GH714_015073 [Hevea brasiliensis]